VEATASSAAAVATIVEAIARSAPRCGSVTVVAIDGGAASGKSTLADALSARLELDRGTSVSLIRTDHLLDGWSGQFTFWTRLRRDVLAPLAAGRAGRYRRYDWLAGQFADEITVPVANVLIVEGVSTIEACSGYVSVGVLIELPRQVRQRRWIARDGAVQPEWSRWLDAEDAYFASRPTAPELIVLPSGYATDEPSD
jgi:uridine kinase